MDYTVEVTKQHHLPYGLELCSNLLRSFADELSKSVEPSNHTDIVFGDQFVFCNAFNVYLIVMVKFCQLSITGSAPNFKIFY